VVPPGERHGRDHRIAGGCALTQFDPSVVFVVIPAYNEAQVLAGTLNSLRPLGYRLVVVDDASQDATAQVAARHPVVLLRHAINLGQGAALETGTEWALAHGAAIIVHFDADGQHDAGQISTLTAPIASGQCDVVFGSRFLRADDIARVPPVKRLLLRAGRQVSGLLTGIWLSDTHNGLRALSRRAAESIRLRENGFAHATEILDEVRRANLRYTEVPVTVEYTRYSRAKGQPISNAFNIVIDLIIRKMFS